MRFAVPKESSKASDISLCVSIVARPDRKETLTLRKRNSLEIGTLGTQPIRFPPPPPANRTQPVFMSETKPDNPKILTPVLWDGASEFPITLRDYFAGHALAGLTVGLVGELRAGGRSEVSAYAHGPCNAVLAERAFAAADAMLIARQKEPTP